MRRHYQRYQLENENLKCILKITSRCPREQWVKEQSCGGCDLFPGPIAVGDTKWDRVIKIWGIHSHEWHYQPQGTCSHTDLYKKNLNIWHLVNQIHPRLPDNLGCFVFNVNFLIVDYFYLRIRYLMKITLMILICDKMWMFKFS